MSPQRSAASDLPVMNLDRNAPASPDELSRVDQILGQMSADLQIEFQLNADVMDDMQVEDHFRDRRSLSRVRMLVLDKLEKITGLSGS